MDATPEKPIDVGPEKPTGEIDQNARTWGMMAHLSGLIAIALSVGSVTGLVRW